MRSSWPAWVAAAAALALPSAALAVPITDGLIAAFEFSGDTLDASGNGRHGSLTGTPTQVADRHGQAAAALLFDGSDNVSIPTDVFQTNALTVSAWFEFDSAIVADDGVGLPVIRVQTPDASIRLGITIGDVSSILEGEVFGAIGRQGAGFPRSGVSQTAFGGPIPAGWHHIVLRTDSSGHTFWFDGVEFVPDKLSVFTPSTNLAPVNGATQAFIGGGSASTFAVDDVFIYGRALSDEEIGTLHAFSPVPEPSACLLIAVASCAAWRRRFEASVTRRGA